MVNKDSSAYYGPSEIIVGTALYNIRNKYPRNSYMIFTKAGRVAENEFDYSPSHIRKSVERSLERFHTSYLDVIYLHDVEFVNSDKAIEALREMFVLKKEGKVHRVGISGYPLDYLYALSLKVVSSTEKKGGGLGIPLDVILSYSNFCLQNTRLEKFISKFQNDAKIPLVISASPLSMGLIRSQPAPGFHPASDELKDAISEAAKYTEKEQDVDLADLAVRFALRNWNSSSSSSSSANDNKKPYVYGLSTVKEVENAVRVYWQVKKGSQQFTTNDVQLAQKVQQILKERGQLDAIWPSGIEHPDLLP